MYTEMFSVNTDSQELILSCHSFILSPVHSFIHLQAAIMVMDHKVCDSIKKLNAEKHKTAMKQKKLEDLQTRYAQMVKDASDAVASDAGESESAQVHSGADY